MDIDRPEEGRHHVEHINSTIEEFVDWPNKPTVTALKRDMTNAESASHCQKEKITKWLDNLRMVGSAARKKSKTKSSVSPKLIRKQAEWKYTSLAEPFLDTDEMFTITPVTYEDKQSAEQNALVLNSQFNTKIDKNTFIDEYIRTAVDEGTVIVRVGWEYKKKPVEEPVFDYQLSDDPKHINRLQILQERVTKDPNYMRSLNPEVQQAFQLSVQQNQPIVPVQTGVQLVDKVISNKPTLEIINYGDITVDPTAKGNIDSANFVILRFQTSLSKLESEGDKYGNLHLINIDNNDTATDSDYYHQHDNGNFNFDDKARKQFYAYEYWGNWDIMGDGVLEAIVATYVGSTLIRLELNPFPDGKAPFVSATHSPVRGSIYGTPDGDLLEDNQNIIGAVTRGMLDIMAKNAAGQQGRKKGFLDVTNTQKYNAGKDYEFNAQGDPRQAVYTHKFPEIPNSAITTLAAQNADAESLTGVRPFAQSSTGNIGSATAQGVKTSTDAASKRELDILRRLADGIRKIGFKFISMNAVWLDETEVVRVTNDEFVEVRRDNLSGNVDLKLNISTAESNKARSEQLAFMLQTTAQTMGPVMSQMILSEIAKLDKMPELAKRIAEYTPEVDPLEEQTKMLQIELLKAQIANENAKANENNANAILDKAKARNENSTADHTDLKYLEQESGVTEEREIRKQGEQARSNIQLEQVKHNNKLRENSQ